MTDLVANRLLIRAIVFYQHSMSSKKGYKCAYGVVHGTHTCSSYGLRIARRYGWKYFLPLIKRQHERCHQAAMGYEESPSSQSSEDGETQKECKEVVGCCGASWPF